MRTWKYRAKEITYLLNPAYCGKIIYSSIKRYNEITQNKKFSFSLSYLILPLMLYPDITKREFRQKYLMNFIKKNPDIFVNYAKRARDLVTITNETIEFLLSGKVLKMNTDSSLECYESFSLTQDVSAKKAEAFGKMLANAGSENVIYIMLGVKP